jgi:hypothetical protein
MPIPMTFGAYREMTFRSLAVVGTLLGWIKKRGAWGAITFGYAFFTEEFSLLGVLLPLYVFSSDLAEVRRFTS